MPQKSTFLATGILLLALIKSGVQWVFITSVAALLTILLFVSGGQDIDATLVKPGVVEIIVGTAYTIAAAFIIYKFADTRGRAFYWIITGIAIAIATITYLVLGSYFVFCLFFGSVAMWYQITLVQHREIPSSP